MDLISLVSSSLDRLGVFYLCLITEPEKPFCLPNAQCGSWDCFHRLVIPVKNEAINFSSVAKIIVDLKLPVHEAHVSQEHQEFQFLIFISNYFPS